MRDRETILRVFADRLEDLRLTAGSPSYAELAKLSPWLRRSTISDVLRGQSNPSLDFVVAFVNACGSHARSRTPLPADLALVDVDSWRQAWLHLQRELGALRRTKRSRAVDAERGDSSGTGRFAPRQLPAAPQPFIGRGPYLEALNGLLTPAEAQCHVA
jgi:hypothetical protein